MRGFLKSQLIQDFKTLEDFDDGSTKKAIQNLNLQVEEEIPNFISRWKNIYGSTDVYIGEIALTYAIFEIY
jgi:hypothetical protein